jgi:biotin operon repressor
MIAKETRKKMNAKQQIKVRNAIASILSGDWMSAEEISVELKRSISLDIDVDRIRRLLRNSNIAESRESLGYRLPNQVDLIDQAILNKDTYIFRNDAAIARAFKISRQAVHKRKKKLKLIP